MTPRGFFTRRASPRPMRFQVGPALWRTYRAAKTGTLLLLAMLFAGSLHSRNASAVMNPLYCSVPGFIESGTAIKPNVYILLDNSLSMVNPAYADESYDADLGRSPDRFDPQVEYYGYFDPTLCYRYNTGNTWFETDGSPSGQGDDPSACPLSGFPFSGNFMNWAYMTRLEVARKVFTGGGYDAATGRIMFDQGVDSALQIPGTPAGRFPELVDGRPADYCIDPEPYTDLSSGEGVHIRRLDLDAGNNGIRQIELRMLPKCSPQGEGNRYHICDYFSQHYHSASTTVNDCDHPSVERSTLDTLEVSPAELAIRVESEPQGIIQELADSARWGLMVYDMTFDTYPCVSGEFCEPDGYNQSDIGRGGQMMHYPGEDPEEMVSLLRRLTTVGWTPTMEALTSLIGYISQGTHPDIGADPRLQESNEFEYGVGTTWDPFFEWENQLNQSVPCRKSFVIVLSDGEPASDTTYPDFAAPGGTDYDGDGYESHPVTNPPGWPPAVHDGDGDPPEDTESWAPIDANPQDWLDDVALWGKVNDIRPDLALDQNLTSYFIYAFGRQSFARYTLWQAAINGAFDDQNFNDIPDQQTEWDKDNDGEPDAFFFAQDGGDVEGAIREALTAIIQETSSGSTPGIAPDTGAGSGVVAQSFFAPTYEDGVTEINWLGFLRGLWLDDFGNLREDEASPGNLVLTEDRIVRFVVDGGAVKAELYEDYDGDGIQDAGAGELEIAEVVGLFEAGASLHKREWTDRRLYAHANPPAVIDDGLGSSHIVQWTGFQGGPLANSAPKRSDFVENEWQKFQYQFGSAGNPYVGDKAKTQKLIRYVAGSEESNWRRRKITRDGSGVWKLGDIMHSSPLIVGAPDGPYFDRYFDSSYDAYRKAHANRPRVAYVGANDGMIHAFAVGRMVEGDNLDTGELEAAYLVPMQENYDAPGLGSGEEVPRGEELWGYIPYNALPHLNWLKEPDYCHSYYVDARLAVRDARIFEPDAMHVEGWGTVLLVAMRLGCKGILGEDGDWRYSSVLVLDITNPVDPHPVLEYTHPKLNFVIEPPAIARIGSGDLGSDPAKQDHCWYLVFGNGPTEYAFDVVNSFGRVHVVPLGATSARRIGGDCSVNWGSIHPLPPTPNVPLGANEFVGGRIPTYDINNNYSVDGMYFGTVVDEGANDWSGRIFRFATDNDPNSNNWRLVPMLETDGPVNHTAPRPVLNVNSLGQGNDVPEGVYLMFGTGIYQDVDHAGYTEQQSLYGVRDDCWLGQRFGTPGLQPQCDLYVKSTDLVDASGCFVTIDDVTGELTLGDGGSCISSDPQLYSSLLASRQGWFLDLAQVGERALADPVVFSSTSIFTSFFVDPSKVCDEGGRSFLYVVGNANGISYLDEPVDLGSGIVKASRFGSQALLSDSAGGLNFQVNPFDAAKITGFNHLFRPIPK